MTRAFLFPGQGAQTIGMGQALAEAYPAAKAMFEEVDEAQRIHLIVEAMRRAYRDRAQYMGDPDFIKVPVDYLVSDSHIKLLAKSISRSKATASASLDPVVPATGNGADTTHFSVVDKQGNKVSATLSINYPFGSGFVAPDTGVLLNDEMDDFSSKPGVPNMFGLIGAEANKIEPGKRMLSSMTPTLVEKDGKFWMTVGTPGGSTIITSVLQTVLNVHEFGMGMQEALTNESEIAGYADPL